MAQNRTALRKLLTELKRSKSQNKPLFDRTFALFYDQTQQLLHVIAHSYLSDMDEIRAAVNLAYENVFLRIHTYDERYDGFNWLYTIVKHAAFDTVKERANHASFDDFAEFIPDRRFSHQTLDDKLDLESALDRLDKKERLLVKQYFYKGVSMEKLGEKLHLTKSTVFYHLDKILKKLKNFLEEPRTKDDE